MGLAQSRTRSSAPPTPIYYQLQITIQKGIQEGRWKPGDRIPPERQLAAQFAVSVGTVRQAIANLVRDGYLERVQGSGTFVRETVWHHERLRYYPMVRDFGDPVQDLKGELISRKVVSAEERTNRLLQIDPDQPLLEIRRLIYLRRKPVVLAISRLPQGMFPGLERLPDDEMIDTPLYLILENHFGRPTIANHELFSVARADSTVRRHLGVARNYPVLQIEMLSMTYKDQPYEHRTSYCRSETERIFRII